MFPSLKSKVSPRWRRGIGIVEISFVALAMLVLAAIAIPKYLSTVQNAKTSSVQEIMHQIATSAANYYAETGYYPGGTLAGTTVTYAATTATTANFTSPSGKSYLPSTPFDPADRSHSVPFAFTGSIDAQGNDSFTIVTPAAHDNATLSQLPNYTATSKHITYGSDSGFTASP